MVNAVFAEQLLPIFLIVVLPPLLFAVYAVLFAYRMRHTLRIIKLEGWLILIAVVVFLHGLSAYAVRYWLPTLVAGFFRHGMVYCGQSAPRAGEWVRALTPKAGDETYITIIETSRHNRGPAGSRFWGSCLVEQT
jgi:hypothetical protein